MNVATMPHRTVNPRNRRRHARVEARGVASHIQTMDGSIPGLAVENISVRGLFVRSAFPLDPGTPVMLQVVRPGLRRAIQVTGQVISAISPAEAKARGSVAGMGIGLDAADGDTEQRLRALVDDLAAVAAAKPAPATAIAAAPMAEAIGGELAEAKETMAAQARRIAELEAEMKNLRTELLRRNRTIGDLANRLAAFQEV